MLQEDFVQQNQNHLDALDSHLQSPMNNMSELRIFSRNTLPDIQSFLLRVLLLPLPRVLREKEYHKRFQYF